MAWIVCKVWKGESITSGDTSQFLSIIKNDVNAVSFQLLLEGFRKMNLTEFSYKAKDTLGDLIQYTLTKFYNDKRVDVPMDIINISHTYHYKDEGKYVSLADLVSKHKIFKSEDFWEASLIYSVQKANQGYDFHDERHSIEYGLVKDNYLRLLTLSFLEIAYNMIEFKLNRAKIGKLLGKYAEMYSLSEENKNQIKNYLNENS